MKELEMKKPCFYWGKPCDVGGNCGIHAIDFLIRKTKKGERSNIVIHDTQNIEDEEKGDGGDEAKDDGLF